MAGMQGANTDELLAFAKRADAMSGEMDGVRSTATPAVEHVVWVGPDRATFGETWRGVDGLIGALANGLGSLAEFLARQAAEQEIASSPNHHPDLSRYGDLIGGDSWGWLFDTQNGADRLLDGFRDKETTGPSWKSQHPDWKPEDIALDADSIHREVMAQGQHGDCWLLSALMSMASQHPDKLAQRISGTGQPPGSAGWDVQLYVDGEWRTEHVAPDAIGTTGAMNEHAPGVLSIYEQAYFQAVDGAPSKIRADSPQHGLETLLGPDVKVDGRGNEFGGQSASDMHAALAAHRSVTICTTLVSTGDSGLVPAHCYEVVAADPAKGTITVKNPWGPDGSAAQYVTVPADSPYILESATEQPPKEKIMAPGPLRGTPGAEQPHSPTQVDA